MQSWHPDLEKSDGPKYLAITAELERDVETGRLSAGDRLPPQRALAERLGVDLTTITRAYDEARRRGLIEADGRRGSFVRARPATLADDDGAVPADTGMNMPPVPRAALAEAWTQGTAMLFQGRVAARLHYQPAGGAMEEREAAARLLVERGVEAGPDMVLVTAGGQHALHAAIRAQLHPGDVVCVGRYAYSGFLTLARGFGLRLRVVEGDEEGMDPDALDAACRAERVRALYIVPTNDNPTTATLGEDRRRAIADIARRHDLAILEDDAYGQLPAAPLPPLATFAPERTWHIASVSKILSPSLRIAHLRAPSVKDAMRAATDLHATAVMAAPLNAALVTAWLENGTYARLIAEVRAEAAWRRGLAADILEGVDWSAHPEGYHLWLRLDEGVMVHEILNALRPAGLSVVPGDAFAVEPLAERRLRVSIGGGLGRERLERNLRLLEAMLHPRGGQSAPLV
jgi:DNA-binding transcriptional MocR family regulator